MSNSILNILNSNLDLSLKETNMHITFKCPLRIDIWPRTLMAIFSQFSLEEILITQLRSYFVHFVSELFFQRKYYKLKKYTNCYVLKYDCNYCYSRKFTRGSVSKSFKNSILHALLFIDWTGTRQYLSLPYLTYDNLGSKINPNCKHT